MTDSKSTHFSASIDILVFVVVLIRSQGDHVGQNGPVGPHKGIMGEYRMLINHYIRKTHLEATSYNVSRPQL